jgi:hypothetical protein
LINDNKLEMCKVIINILIQSCMEVCVMYDLDEKNIMCKQAAKYVPLYV